MQIVVKKLTMNVVETMILTEPWKGDDVLTPRIPIISRQI